MRKKYNFTYFNMSILCIWLQVITEVKVTHQGQVKNLFHFQFYAKFYLFQQIISLCVATSH